MQVRERIKESKEREELEELPAESLINTSHPLAAHKSAILEISVLTFASVRAGLGAVYRQRHGTFHSYLP